MSSYRFLQDHYVNGVTYPAGTVASTFDVGGTLPTGWPPTGQVDPQDTAAIAAFFAAGFSCSDWFEAQWSTQAVLPPIVRWAVVNPNTFTYRLTGAGAALGTAQLIFRGVWP